VLEPTDNYNKILVLDRTADQLIACGTVKQGLCAKYQAADIAAGPPEVLGEAVAANRPEATTFGFVGPSQYSRWSSSDVLYVGTTFTNHGDYRRVSSGHSFALSPIFFLLSSSFSS
jgi:plexin A